MHIVGLVAAARILNLAFPKVRKYSGNPEDYHRNLLAVLVEGRTGHWVDRIVGLVADHIDPVVGHTGLAAFLGQTPEVEQILAAE